MRLLELCANDDGRLETSIRSWAGRDATVAEAVVAVDRRRIAYLGQLLLEIGLPCGDAAARARLVYRAWIGEFMLLDEKTRPERLALAHYLHGLVIGGHSSDHREG